MYEFVHLLVTYGSLVVLPSYIKMLFLEADQYKLEGAVHIMKLC
jgi:hypothetical protein